MSDEYLHKFIFISYNPSTIYSFTKNPMSLKWHGVCYLSEWGYIA